MFSFQCPAIAFIAEHLCWARHQEDALFVNYEETLRLQELKGAIEVAQLERDAARIPL